MKKLIATIGIILLIVVVADTRNAIGDCVPPPAGLISWWPGDGNADDRMNNNPGTAMNGTTYGEGKVLGAFSFDGIDDYVWIGNPDNLKLSQGEYTVDAWVNFTSLIAPAGSGLCIYPGCDFTIVSKMGLDQYGQVNVNGWRLLKQSDNRVWFIVGAPYGAGSGGPNVLQSISEVTAGEWYHVAVVKTLDAMALYVNGELQESKPLPVDYTDDDTSDVVIGQCLAEPASAMYGLIDEVENFARALSQAEIQAIYNAGSAGKCTSPTLTVVKVGSGNCTVMSNPSGINCGDDCSESYPEDTEVTLSVSPDPGSVFGGWSGGGCSGIDGCVVSTTTNTTMVTVTCNHSGAALLSPNDGEIFGPCSMIASYQPTFNWASTETFGSYNIRVSISSTDFKTDKNLLLSAQVSGAKYQWKPDITSWLKIMKTSYNRGSVRDIYWKVIGKRLDGTKIESRVWRFRVEPAQPVTMIDPPDALDSGIAPTFSFNANCNVKFMLEFSPLADFSDPQQAVGFLSSMKDPNADPVKDKTLSWDQWTVVKKRLGAQGYFRIRAWDTINRETLSEIGSIQIYYFLVGNWDISGTETVRVVLDGQSEEGTFSVYDYFTFYLDRRKFSMINLKKGKWKELPNDKYTITFPYDYLASYFERQLEDQLGVNVNIRVTAFSMGGTEKRPEDTIKGKMSLKMSIDIPYYDASGTISDYITYTGYRMSAGYQLDSQETLLKKSPFGKTLGQYLKEMLPDH